MTREVFVAGQILTAAELNVVSDQTVMTFAGTAARGSAIPSPTEGMVAYLNDSNLLTIHDGSAWKQSLGVVGGVLQVVSTTKTDTFTASVASGGTSGEVTGLTATITPRSTSNLIFVIFSLSLSSANTKGVDPILLRAGSAITGAIGAAAGNRVRVTSASNNQANVMQSTSGVFLDSPATTSATTYSFNLHNADNATQTLYVNRSATDTDTTQFARAVSTITLLEVAG